MKTQMVTFPLWLLFLVKILWRFHPQEPYILFVQSPVKMRKVLVWKPSAEKNLIFSFCHGCKVKSVFFVAVRKFMYPRNFVWEHFKIQSILCTRPWDIPHSQVALLLDLLWVCFYFFRRLRSWSTQTLLYLHTPFLCKRFQLTKYGVSLWYSTS